MYNENVLSAFEDREIDIKIREYGSDTDENLLDQLIVILDSNTNLRPWNGKPLPEYIRRRFYNDMHFDYAYLKVDKNYQITSGVNSDKAKKTVTMREFIDRFNKYTEAVDEGFDSVF